VASEADFIDPAFQFLKAEGTQGSFCINSTVHLIDMEYKTQPSCVAMLPSKIGIDK
jgi:hypothetical protein